MNNTPPPITITSKCDPQRLSQVLLSSNKSYMVFSEVRGCFSFTVRPTLYRSTQTDVLPAGGSCSRCWDQRVFLAIKQREFYDCTKEPIKPIGNCEKMTSEIALVSTLGFYIQLPWCPHRPGLSCTLYGTSSYPACSTALWLSRW